MYYYKCNKPESQPLSLDKFLSNPRTVEFLPAVRLGLFRALFREGHRTGERLFVRAQSEFSEFRVGVEFLAFKALWVEF